MEDLRGLQYKPVRALGEGSHGVVLLVEHTRLAKPFVMKLIQQKFLANRDVVGRFIAEAQRGAKLNHEAFAPIVDLGETQDGRTYFVMEYVEGLTLQQTLREHGALPLDQAIVYGLQLLDGLAAAHDAHLIHRDIKPANLFVTTRGRLKILDLGISKSIIDSGTGPNTAHGVAIGTPKYMSPEQAKGQPVSYPADLYAVGLVLFEMLTGSPAFDATDAQELLRQHIFVQAPTLAERGRRAFPAALEDLVARSLRKNPSERFQTAREMQAALHGVLEATRAQAPIAVPAKGSEAARPTVRLDESVPPPEAFPTTSLTAARTDVATTRPVSAEALVIGSASTAQQAVVLPPPSSAAFGSGVDATARTEAMSAFSDAHPLETGGATTRTHDDVKVVEATTPRERDRGRPLLIVAALLGGLALVVASVAGLVLVLKSPQSSAPSAANPTASPVISSTPPPSPPPTAPSVAATPSASEAPAASTSSSASSSAMAPVKPVLAAKPKQPSHYQAAVDAMNAGDLETADSEARLAVTGGGGTQAMLLHAQILERRGKKAGARDIYRQILEKDPTMAAAVAGLKRCGG